LKLREAYEKSLLRDGHERDDAQLAIVDELQRLQSELQAAQATRRGLLHRLLLHRSAASAPVKGLYIWGGVGRGKTFLMDLFFATLDVPRKKRIHFHRMMQDVHARLGKLGNITDPLDRVAADIARQIRVLCFDEFFVSDIGDAMLLGRLLDGLFHRGVTLVATSNSPPEDLYRDGLQRQRFEPAIELLRQYTRILHIAEGTDYRLRLLQKAGTYLAPDDAGAYDKLHHYFAECASGETQGDTSLAINDREIPVRRRAKGIVWFDFDAICDGPRSQNDYIEIARWYPTVIVSGVPQLDGQHEDQARRFMALVDEFYDRRVKLVVAAAVAIDRLYRGQRLQFEFERTLSRLIEMQSTAYLAAPHLA